MMMETWQKVSMLPWIDKPKCTCITVTVGLIACNYLWINDILHLLSWTKKEKKKHTCSVWVLSCFDGIKMQGVIKKLRDHFCCEQLEHGMVVCTQQVQAITVESWYSELCLTINIWTIVIHETKQQSLQMKSLQSPWPQRVHPAHLFLWHLQGCEFIPQGQTVHLKFYCTILRRLREGIWCKGPELSCNGNWQLLARACSIMTTCPITVYF